jgi:hypothetical protein
MHILLINVCRSQGFIGYLVRLPLLEKESEDGWMSIPQHEIDDHDEEQLHGTENQ